MNINAFDLNLLKTFHALLMHGSTVKAADALGLSQPAVSAALGRLRHVFHDPLFVRAGQKLEPTCIALDLKPEIEMLIASLEGILNQDKTFNPMQAQGTLWLSGSDFFSDLLLPKLLEITRREAPNLKLVMVDIVFGTSLDKLEKGEIDLAFWPDIDMPKWVSRRYLFSTQMEFIARKGHPRLENAGIEDGVPLPLNLVCDLAHIHFSPDGRERDDIDAILASKGRERNVISTVPTFAGVQAVVLESDVVGVLPSHLIDCAGPERKFTRHPLPFDKPTIPLAMLWNRKSDNAPVHKWLRSKVAEILGGL